MLWEFAGGAACPFGETVKQFGCGVGVGTGVSVIVGVRVTVGVSVGEKVSVGVRVSVSVKVLVGVAVKDGVRLGVGVTAGVGVNAKHTPDPKQPALKTGTQPVRQAPFAGGPHAGWPEKMH